MNKLLRLIGYVGITLLFLLTVLYGQKIETIDGVRIVHNGKSGKWGKPPKVSLEFVKTIGDLESEDNNILFYMPSDIAFDSQGNMYVLDSGNHRIQKFSPDGKFMTSLGQKGQGPGELYFPLSIDVDSQINLYVSDSGNQRIQILKHDGTDPKTIKMVKHPVSVIRISSSGQMIMGGRGGILSIRPGDMDEEKSLPKLLTVLGSEGEVKKEFGEPLDYKDFLLNRTGNQFHFTVDKNNNTYIAFNFQNRIEKYSPDGKLLWKSDRKLNYDTTSPKSKGSMRRSGGLVSFREPQMNRCSNGIAVDDKGRIWVVTLKRQIKENEQVQTKARVTMSGGQRTMSLSVDGNTEVKETDMYQLEVYAPDGILIGTLQLNQFVDDIRIYKDRLYLLDKMRGMQYYEYKILDK